MSYEVKNAVLSGSDEVIALKLALSVLANKLLSKKDVEDLASQLRNTQIQQCILLADEIEQFKQADKDLSRLNQLL
ncbi:hypothetical protein [Gilliamella sp. Occ4-3]|uniref:hypothetical protein n=1 Tax=Gilliamella sp. Occ4-3 TaxID=3120254 RepID=UPI00080E2A98|nr:hypothetical protein [Gilliamella apicola]OCG79373.1 hypothetical protein A9G44_11615 [Gilliamella apicola]